MKGFLSNFRHPRGFWGRLLLKGMNSGHAAVTAWALTHLDGLSYSLILDIGCGGGAAMVRLHAMYPESKVCGLDISEESIAFAAKTVEKELGSVYTLTVGSAESLPYENDLFQLVTAFETIYFWSDIDGAFREVLRVLQPGGTFLIACEESRPDHTFWSDRIDGLVIYTGEELTRHLQAAGFSTVHSVRGSGGRLCVVAAKDAE